jgi:hypothetical protein
MVERSMADVVTSVATANRIDEGWLRLGRGGTPRLLAAWIGRYDAQLPLSSIAAALRIRSAGHVSKMIKRCDSTLATDEKVRGQLRRCRDELYSLWENTKGKV